MNKEVQKLVEEMTRKLADEGRIVEAGWVTLKILSISPTATAAQLKEMRMAFFAGAQHLFASMMCMLGPGSEPTMKDLERMDMIDKELKKFLAEFKKEHNLP